PRRVFLCLVAAAQQRAGRDLRPVDFRRAGRRPAAGDRRPATGERRGNALSSRAVRRGIAIVLVARRAPLSERRRSLAPLRCARDATLFRPPPVARRPPPVARRPSPGSRPPAYGANGYPFASTASRRASCP